MAKESMATLFWDFSGKSRQEIYDYVATLPFEVEHKQTMQLRDGSWVMQTTILPEHYRILLALWNKKEAISSYENQDLTKAKKKRNSK